MKNKTTLQHRFGSLSSYLTSFDPDRVVILHVVNNAGVWRGGICDELSRKWPLELGEHSPEFCYRQWVAGQLDVPVFGLGKVLSMVVPEGFLVLSVVAEKGVKSPENGRPFKYAAFVDGLRRVADCLRMLAGVTGEPLREVHADWERLGARDGNVAAVLMEEVLVENGFSVTLYS